jgi:phage/plasmid-associated DNA primase
MSNKIVLYQVLNYANSSPSTVQSNEVSIDEAEKLLIKDKNYHLRYNIDTNLLLFLDIDKVINTDTILLIINSLKDFFDEENLNISYTCAQNIKNQYSYHIIIYDYYNTVKEQKKIWNDFLEAYPKLKLFIDLSVYKTGYFRLPNQTTETKPHIHKIIKGCMKEFLLYDISKANKCTFEDDEIDENIDENIEELPNENIDVKTSKIIKLLDCLNSSRCDNYEDWTNIGFIIYNELGDLGLSIYKQFSKQSLKYNSKEFKLKWKNIINSNSDNKLKIGSLVMMAKDDNIEKYKNNKINVKYIFDTELNTNFIANNFYSQFGNIFIHQNNKIYFFNGIYWDNESDKKPFILNNFITNEYYKYLMDELINYETNKMNNSNDKEGTQKRINKIRIFLSGLLNFDKRQKFIEEIICKINNNNIIFDIYTNLFAFNNKVFDLNICDFVESKPEYYISLTCGYNFIEQDETQNIKDLKILINSIFPDLELQKLYLSILSTGLDGQQLEKFIIANGTGGNGKGVLNEFVQYALGKYSYILPASILLAPLKTGSNPEIANLNNKRLVFAREPDNNFKFNISALKELTGGTEINARLCHSNDTTTKLALTFIVECNDKPQFSDVDDAISRRIMDIPFKNKFVDKFIYDKLNEEEKKITFLKNGYYKTIEFKNKYKQAIFFILVEHYKIFKNNNRELPICEEVDKRNKSYLASSDELYCWFTDIYEYDENIKNTIKVKDVYNRYILSSFYVNLNKVQKRNNNYKKFCEKIQTNIFLRNFFKIDRHGTNLFINYKLKVEEDEEDEDEEEDN